MKTLLKTLACAVAMAACTAHGVNVVGSTGDIATGEAWGGSVPTSDIARFNTSSGKYTAEADVTLGSVQISQNTTFNLDTSGNHTIKTSKFYFGWYQRTVNINGGIWDLSGTLSSDTTAAPDHYFATCNGNGAVHTITATLSKGCIVTNATSLRVGYNSNKNQLKITDSSRIYVNGSANLWINHTAINGLLEMSSGGQLDVTGTLYDGYANTQVRADTTNSIVVTGNGSKLTSAMLYIGSHFGRNSLLVSDGGELSVPTRFILGNSANGNTNSAVFETGAKFLMRDIRTGEGGSCGNALKFLSGASGTIEAGGRIGGWDTPGSDNTMLVSNATVSVTGILAFGVPKGDASGISGNGLIIQGATPSLDCTSNILVKNRSFLRIEVPAGGYADGFTPLSASSVTFDDTSAFEIVVPDASGMPDSQRLISTTGGITISDAVLGAAKSSVSAQSNGKLRLVKADGGKAIDLKVVKGLVIMFN